MNESKGERDGGRKITKNKDRRNRMKERESKQGSESEIFRRQIKKGRGKNGNNQKTIVKGDREKEKADGEGD